MSALRITCFIDSLDTGGAQRQLCNVAVMLKKNGADVSVLTYRDNQYFLPLLDSAGIEYMCLSHNSKIKRALEVRKALRNGNHDVVLAFLPSPCIYAELAAIPMRKWGLVVSERSAVPGSHLAKFSWRRNLHRVADYVCTNSHTNRLMIERSVPQLIGRVATVYNLVDLDYFHPVANKERNTARVKLVIIASHQHNKNLVGLVKALSIVQTKAPETHVDVEWYGDMHPDTAPYDDGVRQILENDLGDRIHFYPAQKTLVDVYNSADVVALCSFYEGLPNVVCEAMACGRPVLLSKVSDSENLVRQGVNGFLFDPTSPDEIADAIIKFCKLGQCERELMGRNSRQMAEQLFNSNKIHLAYLRILEAAASRRKISVQHWISEVPPLANRIFDNK